MKFKITVISLLTAILAVCSFTSYTLIKEAKTQTTLVKFQTEAIMIMERMSRDDESTKVVPREQTRIRHDTLENQWKQYISYDGENRENWEIQWKNFIEKD